MKLLVLAATGLAIAALSAARAAAPRNALSLGRTAHLVMRARYGLLNPVVRALRLRRGVGRETGGGPR